jgi:hypothetical protein
VPELLVLDAEVLDEDALLVEAIMPPVPLDELDELDELDAAPPLPPAPVPHMHAP